MKFYATAAIAILFPASSFAQIVVGNDGTVDMPGIHVDGRGTSVGAGTTTYIDTDPSYQTHKVQVTSRGSNTSVVTKSHTSRKVTHGSKNTYHGKPLNGANFSGQDLRSANFGDASLGGADFSNADLRGANLSGAYLQGANLVNTDLRGANLSDADLRGANTWGADLRGANLDGTIMNSSGLRNTDLRGANMSDVNINY